MERFVGLGIIENVEKEIKTLKAKQERTSLKDHMVQREFYAFEDIV